MKKPSKNLIIEAIIKANGLVKPAAEVLGVTRQTLYDWIKKDEDLQMAQLQARESLIDLAESRLFKNVNEGDNTSIIFALKTLGKDRGYIERSQWDHTGDITIHIKEPDFGDDN